MNTMYQALFLFLILLVALLLCSFLGGNCNKTVEGLTSSVNSEDKLLHVVTGSECSSPSNCVYNHYTRVTTPLLFFGPQYSTATMYPTNTGYMLTVVYSDGQYEGFNEIGTSAVSDPEGTKKYHDATLLGTDGGTATVNIDSKGNMTLHVTRLGGISMLYTPNNIDNTTTNTNTDGSDSNTNTGSSVSASDYNSVYTAAYNAAYNNFFSQEHINYDNENDYPDMTISDLSSIYSSSLPPGIPASQIPRGQEDLYILKSAVVPPVCPACPAYPSGSSSNNGSGSSSGSSKSSIPPCPPCDRCPEPSFDCKKVPNYKSNSGRGNNSNMPNPIVGSYSMFGV